MRNCKVTRRRYRGKKSLDSAMGNVFLDVTTKTQAAKEKKILKNRLH